MIQLRTLGTLDLRSPEHEELRQVLAQPKRFALLVYLTVAPGPFHRRDTLFALFWPESDTEHARSSLRTALHFLRRLLSHRARTDRNTVEVSVAPGALWCDARAFEAELDAGRLEAALELYRGAFLAGFNLAGVAEWERWVSDERDRLRRRAVEAAEALAARADAEGDARGVVRWSRRAAALDPDDEGALRRLMKHLARTGDGAAAIHLYEEFARRLRAEYDSEPSSQTRALALEIRRGTADPVPAARPELVASRGSSPRTGGDALDAHPVPARSSAPAAPSVALPDPAGPAGPPEPASASAPVRASGPGIERALDDRTPPVSDPAPRAGSEPAARPIRRRGWPWWMALAAIVVAVALVWRGGARVSPPAAPARVAVLPFSVYGTAEVAYLREGMVDLLSSKLDGAGELRSVDVRALLATVEPRAEWSPGTAAEAAERLGAELFVLGSVAEAGPQVQLRATLYRQHAGDPQPQADAAVQGVRDSLPRLVDRLAAQLLAGRLNGPGARLQRTAVLATPSVPALKAYLQGESALRRGHYGEAKRALERAVAEDSTFALAWYRLSVAIAGSGRRTGEAPRHAVRLAERLDPHDRLLLQAWLASWDFRYADAERMYRQAVAARPDDVEAWSQLAQVLFHGGPPRGQPSAESRPAWERVLALEPENVEALGYLARIAMAERRMAAADSLLARALALNPDGDRAVVWRGYRGVALGDREALDSAVAGVRRSSDLGAWVIAWRMVEDTRAPAAARPLVEPLMDPLRPARVRASGRVLLAHTELARGRWRAARDQLDSAAELDPAVARQARTLFATLPFLPVDAGEVARVRAELLAAPHGTADAPPGPEPQEAPVPAREIRLHALGLLEARAGNAAAALEYARRLDAFDPPSPGVRIRGPLLADGVRAHVSWLTGRPAGGLARMDSAWQERDRKAEVYPYLLDPGHPRFLRAELLRMLGRDREALRWYGSVTEHFDKSIVYVAPVHLRTAEILERLGRPAEAAAHYARFVELWRDCDPALRPMVERARLRLQRLQP